MSASEHQLTGRQRAILEFIEAFMEDNGYPPSVREIGKYVGMRSSSTVHTHLNNLQEKGFLTRDPSTPRGLRVNWDSATGAVDVERRPMRHVPLVGEVAAGTDVLAAQNIEESLPVPADFTGEGDLFMLRVKGDSMIEAGILDGDFVIANVQNTAGAGDVVVAGIPGDEATIKTYSVDSATEQIVLLPANPALSPMAFPPEDVQIFGRVVTVMRRL
ncbi:MAG: transcriptional repressor LexA [Acidimicrobiia bacterium]|nr:transcriptional repressor LexA [Acidimicrobiia bacterium]